MSGIKLPLTLSIAGHALCLALLVAYLSPPPPKVQPATATGGIEVIFEQAPPKPEPTPISEPEPQPEAPSPPAETPPPEPQIAVVPPTPEPPSTVTEPTPPAPEPPVVEAKPPPPPPRKPAVKRLPQPVAHHLEPVEPSPIPAPAAPMPPVTAAPQQTALAPTPVPAPVPSPQASAGYGGLLSAWLEAHKRYPDGARERGEQGRAVLRFEVDRSGRVLDYAVTTSSGYADLDRSIEEMMRGATLPPFPAGMPQPRMQISVAIRFSLRR